VVGLKVPVVAVVMLVVGLLIGVGIGYALFPAHENDTSDLDAQLRAAQNANHNLTRLVYDLQHPPSTVLSVSEQSIGEYKIAITSISRNNITNASVVVGIVPDSGVTIHGMHVADATHHYLAVNDYAIVSGLSSYQSYSVKLIYSLTGNVMGDVFIAAAPVTPTGAMSYSMTSSGNYTFTLLSISSDEVNNSTVSIQVSPPEGVVVRGMYIPGGGSILQAGNYFNLSGLTPSVQYTVSLKYLPTGGMISVITFTAS